MAPLMGAEHAINHTHHAISDSCATCIGMDTFIASIFVLTLVGLTTVIIPIGLPFPPVRNQFHPPRPR